MITSELLEIIEWNDDSRDTLSYRYPDHDRAIKRGARLVVRESQAAQFVYLGQFADTVRPRTHTLVTGNIPILTRLKGWKYGFESPFKTDVYFVTTRLFPGNQWGTASPVMLHDKDLASSASARFGTYDFRVAIRSAFFVRSPAPTISFAWTSFRPHAVAHRECLLRRAGQQPRTRAGSGGAFTELGEALLPLINPSAVGKVRPRK